MARTPVTKRPKTPRKPPVVPSPEKREVRSVPSDRGRKEFRPIPPRKTSPVRKASGKVTRHVSPPFKKKR